MQKKLIALAVAAAFSAPAFADVTMYGVADATLVRASGDGQKSDMQAVSGGLAGSRLGVKAVEDLDNGMKAVVVLEYGLDIQTNSTVGVDSTSNVLSGTPNGMKARQQMLAVAGGFGTFATGFLQTTGYDFASKFDPTAGSAVSPLQSMTAGGNFLVGSATIAARAQRALAYISPDMGGVTVAVNYSTDTGLGSTVDGITGGTAYGGATGLGDLAQASTNAKSVKIPAYLISATYAPTAIPLVVGFVIADANAAQYDAHIKDMALGASYDLSVVKLMGTYQTTKLDVSGAGLGSSKAMSFSAVAPVGPGAVVFTYAKNTLDDKTYGTDASGSGYTVAWLQGLSKTTTLYVALEKVSQGKNSGSFTVLNNALSATGTLTPGGSSTVLALGLNKKF